MGVTLFDDASLVLIPSGIKASKVYSVKPEDGTGDLDFSRASSATRVNSAGLIEKVRTNFIRNSSMVGAVAGSPGTLPTNWGVTPFAFAGLTRTIIGTGTENGLPYVEVRINGTATGTAASIYTEQNNSASPSQVFANSVYLKYTANPNPAQSVNISTNFFNGVTFVNSQITTVVPTNNLTRFVGIHTASSATLNVATTNISFTSTIGQTYDFTIRIAAPQMELAEAASDWIATTTAAVTVGPTNNVPRLDYSGGATCPRLLLEPQRTNLALRSEEFDTWTQVAITVTANTTTSPDGTTDADTISIGVDGSAARHRLYQQTTLTIGTTYTGTYYLKKQDHDWIQIVAVSGFSANVWANFNLANGTIGNTGGVDTTASIEDVGNGWYRCRVSGVATGTSSTGFEILVINNTNGIRYPSYQSTQAANVCYVWGTQLEAGSFPSSYIPTTTAAVTRLADACSKTGISSLIGQTEGTLFVDILPTDLTNQARYISIESSTSLANGWIGIFAGISNNFRFFGDNWDFSAGSIVRGTRYKVAMAYKNGVLTSAYINGTSVGTLTANTTGKSYANLKLANATIGAAGCSDFFQSLIFKTALTNAQLAELTTL